MKNITVSCRQILRAIRAACIALFLAACASHANAAPTSNDYTVNGTTVTGNPVNDSTGAFFYDPSKPGPAYTITVPGSATLGNDGTHANGNEIEIDNGSVNNSGALSSTTKSGIYFYSSGSVTNSGSIIANGAGGWSVVFGSPTLTGTGSVTNSGYMHSDNGVAFFAGDGTVKNSGQIIAASGRGLYIGGNGTVTNSNYIAGKDGGVYIVGAGTVTNSGSIYGLSTTSNYDGVYLGSGTVSNTGHISSSNHYGVNINGTGTVSNTAGGSISSFSQAGVNIGGNGTVTNGVNSSITSSLDVGVLIGGDGMVTNSGTISGNYVGAYIVGTGGATSITNSSTGDITGVAVSSGSNYAAGIGFGGMAPGASSFSLNNSGTISGYIFTVSPNGDSTSYGVNGHTDSGDITIQNSGLISASGKYNNNGKASNLGISVFSNTGNITVTNTGVITGSASSYYDSTGTGISATNVTGKITITNNGVTTSSSYSYGGTNGATASGIYASNTSGDIEIANAGKATATASSYYSSTSAYGISAGSMNGGSIMISNTGTASATATNQSGFNTNNAFAAGIFALASSGDINISNAGTVAGTASTYGSGSAYGVGLDIISGTGNITVLNSGRITGSASSYYNSGSNSGYGMLLDVQSGTIAITNESGASILGTRANPSGTSAGIFLTGGTGGGSTTITNKGTISAYYGIGVDARNYHAPVTFNAIGGAVTTTGSGTYSGYAPAIALGVNADNTVNIVGRSNITGLIDGGNAAGNNTLTFTLVGLSPAEKAIAQQQVQNGTGSGYFKAGGETYSWTDFQNVSGSFVSLEQVVDPGLNDIATKLDNLSAPLPIAFDPFYQAALANPEQALNLLVGREFDDALSTIGVNNATALGEIFDSRAVDLRFGTGGLNTAGLNIMSGSMIASLGATENTLSRLLGTSSVLGGTTMSDSKEAFVTSDENRWGAWASGTVTFADEDSTFSSPGFNATTGSPTIGADYRVNRNLVLGALLNFSTTGANFGDGSRLGVQTGLGGLYGTYSDGPWYINALVGGGYSSYDNERATLGGTHALSNPDGNEVIANLTGGYDFKLNHEWTISPEAGFLYTHLTENSFTERNAGAFNLNVAEQNVDSLRSKLGFHIINDFQWDHIKFTQQFRAAWYHECLDDSRGVNTSLPGAPGLGSFIVQTNQAERDFAIAGAGLSATPEEFHNNVTFFVNYDAQVGQSNYMSHTVNGGLRIGF